MACPFFEPLAPVAEPEFRNGRLPLIQEHLGTCHAGADLATASGAACNHGYPRGACERFPATEPSTALRYSVLRDAPGELELLCIVEERHAPVRTRRLHFSVEFDRLRESDLETCLAAQTLAFCRAYLRVVAGTRNNVRIESPTDLKQASATLGS
jgi:hypothetical protein